MNATYKMLEKLETPEGKAKIEKHIEEYIENQKIRDKKIKDIMSNTDYIEWLKTFTQDKDSFTEEDLLYCQEKITDLDRENISNLSLFYDGIERYASNNHIVPNYFDFGEFYKIKYNNFFFKIGIAYGQGNSIFCHKVTGKNLKGFINFNSILTNDSDSLNKLSNLVMAMLKSDIPTEDIINTVNATVNNSKRKVLKKGK